MKDYFIYDQYSNFSNFNYKNSSEFFLYRII